MSIRYIPWVAFGIAAAFLVVASTAFALIDISNLALGVGIGTLVISVLLADRYRTDVATLVVAAATAIVSAWMIVYSTVFSLHEAPENRSKLPQRPGAARAKPEHYARALVAAGASQRSRSSRTASIAGRSSSAIWSWL